MFLTAEGWGEKSRGSHPCTAHRERASAKDLTGRWQISLYGFNHGGRRKKLTLNFSRGQEAQKDVCVLCGRDRLSPLVYPFWAFLDSFWGICYASMSPDFPVSARAHLGRGLRGDPCHFLSGTQDP